MIWVNHHQLFTRIAVVDGGLLWANLGLLLTTSVLPFPTAVLGHSIRDAHHGDRATAVVLYAVIAGLMPLSWLLVFRHLEARHADLVEPATPTTFFRAERRRALLGVISYVSAAVIGLVLPLAGLAVLLVVPVFYAATSEGWRRAPGAR